MATRVAEYCGDLWEVVSVGEGFFTGQRMVIIRRYYRNPEDIINKGCSYGAVAYWTLTAEEFKEGFKWVHEME